jgi:hypothetical protein
MQIVTLESKQPYEIVAYKFDFSRWITTLDPITQVAFGIYLKTDDPGNPTLIVPMIYGTGFTATTATCAVGSGNDTAGTYVCRARVTCGASGLRFEQEGVFVVKEI